MFNKGGLKMQPSTKKRKEKIMMTTVMILAVVAVMIAKAVNVNNKMEMGK